MSLNIEVMKKLYEFGGLYAYKLSYIDPLSLELVVAVNSFNEEYIDKEFDNLKKRGLLTKKERTFISFHGAYSE